MTRSRSQLLTRTEVVSVVSLLDGRKGAVTHRQLRYWSAVFEIGRGRATAVHNGAQLFDVEGVALVRLVRRLQRDEISARVIWSLLVVQGDALRLALYAGRILWLEPNGRGHFITRSEAAGESPRECYALDEFKDGIATAIAAVRRGNESQSWNGAAWVPIHQLLAAATVAETLIPKDK